MTKPLSTPPPASPSVLTRVPGGSWAPTTTAAPEVRQRLAEVEKLLAAGRTPRQARRELAQQHQISNRHAAKYVRAVYRLWAAEANEEPAGLRIRRRAEGEATLREVIVRGMGRTRLVVDHEGREHIHPDPDLRSVVLAVETLGKLHNIIEPEDHRSVHFHGTPQEAEARMFKALHEIYLGPVVEQVPSDEVNPCPSQR